jgi:hypothetical protein
MNWFWESRATVIKNNREKRFEDDYIVIEVRRPWHHYQGNTTNYQDLDYNVKQGNIEMECKNKFLEQIKKTLTLQNWVDVEEEYFTQLKAIINNRRIPEFNQPQYIITDLNRDFDQIKKALEEYLIGELDNYKPGDFKLDNISQKFNTRDFMFYGIDDDQELKKYSHNINTPYKDCETPIYPSKTLFLNFNYTDLAIKLIKYIKNDAEHLDDWIENSFGHLFIHGKLGNTEYPIIFGYGDERDEIQKDLEKHGGEYLDNIKTINYLKTQNYKILSGFVDEGQYQIFIWGHSCGLSDKTLLNTLFEGGNCVSIKPFYYTDKNGHNNYEDIVKNIYRCFNNKVLMRDKVVNKSYCSEL